MNKRLSSAQDVSITKKKIRILADMAYFSITDYALGLLAIHVTLDKIR
jgi:hypothetical protein